MTVRQHGHVQIKAANPGVQKVLLGAFGLPFGLALIVICGAELFTANTAFMSAAFYEVSKMLLLRVPLRHV